MLFENIDQDYFEFKSSTAFDYNILVTITKDQGKNHSTEVTFSFLFRQ